MVRTCTAHGQGCCSCSRNYIVLGLDWDTALWKGCCQCGRDKMLPIGRDTDREEVIKLTGTGSLHREELLTQGLCLCDRDRNWLPMSRVSAQLWSKEFAVPRQGHCCESSESRGGPGSLACFCLGLSHSCGVQSAVIAPR